MEPREAMTVNLAFRTGMLVGTINMSRDLGFTVEEIADVTHLSVEEIERLSAAVSAVPGDG
jgi:chemotaxis signal transduction protein